MHLLTLHKCTQTHRSLKYQQMLSVYLIPVLKPWTRAMQPSGFSDADLLLLTFTFADVNSTYTHALRIKFTGKTNTHRSSQLLAYKPRALWPTVFSPATATQTSRPLWPAKGLFLQLLALQPCNTHPNPSSYQHPDLHCMPGTPGAGT